MTAQEALNHPFLQERLASSIPPQPSPAPIPAASTSGPTPPQAAAAAVAATATANATSAAAAAHAAAMAAAAPAAALAGLQQQQQQLMQAGAAVQSSGMVPLQVSWQESARDQVYREQLCHRGHTPWNPCCLPAEIGAMWESVCNLSKHNPAKLCVPLGML